MRRYADIDVQRAMTRVIDGRPLDGRKAQIDQAMRELQHQRANRVLTDPRLAVISDVIAATRK
jgi:exoribonuclease R